MKDTTLIATRLFEAAVQAGTSPDRCHICGAMVVHGLQGCVELFAEICGRSYRDPRYRAASFYGVDAHALQHPEIHGRKNNAAHLLRLHWIFAHNQPAQAGIVSRWWQAYLGSHDIPQLTPPENRGHISVADIPLTNNIDAYALAMEQWARSVYQAWGKEHDWAEHTLWSIFTDR